MPQPTLPVVYHRSARQPITPPVGRGISAINTPQLRTAPAVRANNARYPNGNPNSRGIGSR